MHHDEWDGNPKRERSHRLPLLLLLQTVENEPSEREPLSVRHQHVEQVVEPHTTEVRVAERSRLLSFDSCEERCFMLGGRHVHSIAGRTTMGQ